MRLIIQSEQYFFRSSCEQYFFRSSCEQYFFRSQHNTTHRFQLSPNAWDSPRILPCQDVPHGITKTGPMLGSWLVKCSLGFVGSWSVHVVDPIHPFITCKFWLVWPATPLHWERRVWENSIDDYVLHCQQPSK